MTKASRIVGICSIALLMILNGCQKDIIHQNKVPVVNAGESQTITLPKDYLVLTGVATDADGDVVAYLWSQVSGPSPATIENPGSPSTNVTHLQQGTYLFQLMATDNKGATGVDTTTVVVTASEIHTLTLQPDNNPNEVKITNLGGQDISGSGGTEISIDAWTSGSAWTLREIFKFDLSSIPSNATVISANLYLYSNPTPGTGNLVNANFGSDNSLVLQQITSDWNPATVGWFTQPSVATGNQILIPHTDQSVLDLNLDVSSIVTSMVTTGNYGFALKLQNEVIYNSRIFVSSYNTTYPLKHPKLVVQYQ